MQKLIILDSNKWIQHQWLTSAISRSLLFHIKQTDCKILIPDILREEIKYTTWKKLNYDLQKLRNISDDLNKFKVTVEPPQKFTFKEFENNYIKRLQDLDQFIVGTPIKYEHHKNATVKLLKGISPNSSKKQSYKDSLIWESIVELCNDYHIHFITADSDFYDNSGVSINNLAKNLKMEIKRDNFCIYPNIEMYLKNVQSTPILLGKFKVIEVLKKSLPELLIGDEYFDIDNLGKLEKIDVDGFATEYPSKYAISFKLYYSYRKRKVTDVPEEFYFPLKLKIEGVSLLNSDKDILEETSITKRLLYWPSESGFALVEYNETRHNLLSYLSNKAKIT